MTTLAQVVLDWKDESDQLDVVLETLVGDDWHKETPAEGWDTRDTIGHLADTNDVMLSSVTGGDRDLFKEASEAAAAQGLPPEQAVDAYTAWQMEKVRQMSGREVHDWWRQTTQRLHDLILSLDETERYPWGGNTLTPKSLASARIMETWAHSLDIHAAHGFEYVDTDRIYHVAFLGWRALPHAFGLVGLDAPSAFRIELEAPSGTKWTLGDADAPNVITGSASDWCRVVARRDRDGAAGRLRGEGPDAANAIEHGRAFL